MTSVEKKPAPIISWFPIAARLGLGRCPTNVGWLQLVFSLLLDSEEDAGEASSRTDGGLEEEWNGIQHCP